MNTQLLILGGTLAALTGLLLVFRDQLVTGVGVSVGLLTSAAFRAALQVGTPNGRAAKFSEQLLQAARESGTDPFVLAAIMERESRSGEALDPAGRGDGGHGHGLMQIDDRSHQAWLATGVWRDPLQNIRYGAKVLKENLVFFARPGVGREDPRPLQGQELLQAAVAAYNTGAANVLRSIKAGKHPDATTAHANYSQDVLQRAEALRLRVA